MFKRSNIALFLMVAAVLSSLATYYAISESSVPGDPHTSQVLGLVILNIVLLLAFAVFVSNKLVSLWLARKRGSVGSRLQTRIVIMFSLVSIIPTSIVAVFSIFYSIYVIQGWVSERVGTALEESVKVAEGYVDEHRVRIKADSLAMANYLNSQFERFKLDPKIFGRAVGTQARLLALNEAMVFRKSDIEDFVQKNSVLARTQLSFALESQIAYLQEQRPDLLKLADDGEVVTYFPRRGEDDSSDRILSLLRLYRFEGAYLIAGRFVDSKVLSHMESSKGAAREYNVIKSRLTDQQVMFGLIFVIVAILLLLAALWVGISFAGELVGPISQLIRATESVKAGALDTRVPERHKDDEVGTLGRAFNRMTDQLQKHNRDMLEVNRMIDSRRRFTEDVLSGVSAGIIALDIDRMITLFNRTVPELLMVDGEMLKGKNIDQVFVEAAGLVERATNSLQKQLQEEIVITRDGKRSTLLVRVVREEFSDQIDGYIVTFDDMTELQSAQRSAAWSDVARRIAHEIKNPLTPIHLSAERLRKKFGMGLSEEEQDVFNRYLDTIVRHTENIKDIVEEFVGFARMPSPERKSQDVITLIQEAITSQEVVYGDVAFSLNAEKNKSKFVPVLIDIDAGQIGQVLTNLLKNAAEALEDMGRTDKKISINVIVTNGVFVEIVDNGAGFPEHLLDRITEPYVTTKETGTGLGLAIVKKVMVDHDGGLQISNVEADGGRIAGARVVMSFLS